MNCDGTWRPTKRQNVLKCDGCGEVLVIILNFAYHAKPGTKIKQAMKQARLARREAMQ